MDEFAIDASGACRATPGERQDAVLERYRQNIRISLAVSRKAGDFPPKCGWIENASRVPVRGTDGLISRESTSDGPDHPA